MAKLDMQKFQLVGLQNDMKSIMDYLQRKSAVEITGCELPDEFYSIDVSKSVQRYEKNSELCSQALAIADEMFPEKKSFFASFSGRKEMTAAEFKSMALDGDIIVRKSSKIVAADKSISDSKIQIQRINLLMDSLEPWLSLDVPMQYAGTASTMAFIGYVPSQMNSQQLKEAIAAVDPALEQFELEVISSLKNQTCVFFLCHKDISAAFESAIRSIGFTRPSDPTKHPPQVRMNRYKSEVDVLNKKIEEAKEIIRELSSSRNDIRFGIDYYNMRRDSYDAVSELMMSENAFIMNGYVVKETAQVLLDELSGKFKVAVDAWDPEPDEEVPVALKNNWFVEPVEPITEMYSLPTRHEIDPNPVMSFFYYALFGLMLSDAAYGIIMIIACAFVLKKLKPEGNLRKSFKMFLFCGISTTFWGAIFGSWFGDVVSVVSQTFFGKEFVLKPIWFSPLDDPMKMLYFSMAFGLIHIFFGLGCAFYQLWHNGHKKDAIYDVGFWYMLLGGVILFGLGTVAGLPGFVTTIGIVIALVGVVGIIAMTGRSSKSPFKRIAKGLYAVYGVTSYLSDVLSYSRLLALGLATGVIASVINTMGAMFGGSVVGAIAFVVVFLLGHTLNIAINLLGAYVHCNRLQYVEFFGKFFEGGGKAFSPLRPNTKYYKFKEEK